ncbi:hypothetical protein B0H19DRAFT_939977, partial [Mycena capillaripes]
LVADSTAVKVDAQDFVAFTGNACTGGVGGDVVCDGTCFDFAGRHSFEITSATDVCVTLFESASCVGNDFPFGRESHGSCINVNTGTNIQSFSCVHC